MREFETADVLANRARMVTAIPGFTALLVEGGTDATFIEGFVNTHVCKVIDGNGRPIVLGAMQRIRATRDRGILAVVDADFWHLDKACPRNPDILPTDTHDMETMLLRSVALERVLKDHAAATKVQALGREIRRALLDAALPLGHLRWLAEPTKWRLGLSFDNLDYQRFVNYRTLAVTVRDVVSEVLRRNPGCKKSFADLTVAVQNAMQGTHDPWQVCCGHDMTEVLALGMRRALGGSRNARTRASVEALLRRACDLALFRCTGLYAKIVVWELNNKPLQVLCS